MSQGPETHFSSTRAARWGFVAIFASLAGWVAITAHGEAPCEASKPAGAAVTPAFPPAMKGETAQTAREHSAGCLSCHLQSDQATMHLSPAVTLGCADCHGGNATVSAAGFARDSAEYAAKMKAAHVLPRDLKDWKYPSAAIRFSTRRARRSYAS
jgi:hypothetical protein